MHQHEIGVAAKGRRLRMRQPWLAEEVAYSTQRPRLLGKSDEKNKGRETSLHSRAAWKARAMPEVDHGSAAAKYFLTGSLTVRMGILALAGRVSHFAANVSSRVDREQIGPVGR